MLKPLPENRADPTLRLLDRGPRLVGGRHTAVHQLLRRSACGPVSSLAQSNPLWSVISNVVRNLDVGTGSSQCSRGGIKIPGDMAAVLWGTRFLPSVEMTRCTEPGHVQRTGRLAHPDWLRGSRSGKTQPRRLRPGLAGLTGISSKLGQQRDPALALQAGAGRAYPDWLKGRAVARPSPGASG